MDHAEILALFDRDQRREITFPETRREVTPFVTRHIPVDAASAGCFILHSQLAEHNADAVIEAEIAYLGELCSEFEWKLYDYDRPSDLRLRLEAHGLEIEEREAVLALDLENAPPSLWQPVKSDIRRITEPAGLDDVLAVKTASVGELPNLARRLAGMLLLGDSASIYVAYVDGAPAAAAWIRFDTPGCFAGLWGGSTVPAFRRRGLYTDLVALRAQEARSKGYRFLTIDASPMSRPICEKHGFTFLTYSYPCVWHKPQA